jgi:two-component system CheB/CheR fusion protein
VDIDEIKRASEEVRQARDFNQSIRETTRSPLLVLDTDLHAKLANPAFYQMFQLTPDEVVGRTVYDVAGGSWAFPALRALIESVSPADGRLDNAAVEHDFARVGRKSLAVSARWFRGGSDREQLLLLAIDDMTGRKQIEAPGG